MAVHQVSVKIENPKNKVAPKGPSFRGVGATNPIIWLMDGIDNGGYVAQFLVQDAAGMAAPRTGAALYRNRDKTKKYNWEYATLVAIREVLSAPSMFVIPMIMLHQIKGRFGKANDVPINFIKGFGDDFAEFAAANQQMLKEPQALKRAYYEYAVRNLLNQSTQGDFYKIDPKEFKKASNELADKLIEIDGAPQRKFWWSKRKDASGKPIKYAADLEGEFVAEFVKLKKKYFHNGPTNRTLQAFFTIKNKIFGAESDAISNKPFLETNINRFIHNLRNFTYDAVDSVKSNFNPEKQNIKDFIEHFTHKRAGSRFIATMSMTFAVALFYLTIPKMYNLVSKGNPELAGLDEGMRPGSLPPVLDHVEEGSKCS